MQTAELANSLASTFAKTIKPSADNHDLEDELSFKASVANNPYYPYNQELFGHDEEDTPNLAEEDTPICLVCTTAKMLLLIKKIPNDYGRFVTFSTKCQNGEDWLFELKFRTLLLLS